MAANSLFDQDNQGSDELANLTPEAALETLVGEGKKYATVNDLALAYAHANVHLGKLQNENSQLRSETEKARTIEEVLAQLKPAGTDTSTVTDPDKRDTPDGKLPNIEELIAQEFAKRDSQAKEQQAKQNVESVTKTLSAKFGQQAAALYKAKGEELGIDLDELAAKSPQAVLAYFGSTPATTTNLNTSGKGHQHQPASVQENMDTMTKAGLDKMFKEGKINREEKFRLEHIAIGKVGADVFFGRSK